MKRVQLHIIFWVAYLAEYTVAQVSHMQPFLKGIPAGTQILMGAEAALIVLPIKLMVAYYAIYVFLKSLLNEKRRIIISLLGIVIVLAISVIMFRVASYYYINPIVYQGKENHPPLFTLVDVWVNSLEIGSVAAIAVIIKFVRLQFQGREKERLLVKQKLEAELKFLRSQTNPHFLFNTLNNIYALALKKSDDTPGVVMKLSKLLHFMLYESGKKMINIGDEMKILDDYIELERIRYNRRLDIDFTKEIDNDKEQIAPLLLLSFVENAFKHGASESRFESYIHIDVKVRSGVLEFNIENTKEDCDRPVLNGNIGLANAKRQIELLYTNYHLTVEDEKSFFKISLLINIHSHAKI